MLPRTRLNKYLGDEHLVISDTTIVDVNLSDVIVTENLNDRGNVIDRKFTVVKKITRCTNDRANVHINDTDCWYLYTPVYIIPRLIAYAILNKD